ncbi:hypothetical protein AB1Y20_009792 [Prymnesium parvum]|uniref:Uncharacterized protein n=1 Tax=Prymnesium parvum TaxID=97485 RepID=A0AB34K6Y2_PRYPA
MDLYAAAYHGNAKTVKKILARTPPAQLPTVLRWRHPHGGASALYVACEFGQLEVAKLLLEAGAPPDQARDDGATPLYKACQDGGRIDVAKLLLQNGANADQVDKAGMTPLWVACHQGRTELAAVLLDANADPRRKVQGWSPLDLARRDKREELIKLILSHLPASEAEAAMRPSHGALFRAVCHGDEKAVRQLLADGADVQAQHTEDGATALYAACKNGLGGMVQLLLDNHADPNIGEKKGMTPLAAVADSGRVDLARLLLAAGADVNLATGAGGRPLMVACYRGKAPMVRLLLDHGAEADSAGRVGGGTPLISASCMGHADCVRLLLDEGVNVSEQFEGLTALGWALRQGHRACARLLEEPTYAASAVEAEGAARREAASPAEAPACDCSAAAPTTAVVEAEVVEEKGGKKEREAKGKGGKKGGGKPSKAAVASKAPAANGKASVAEDVAPPVGAELRPAVEPEEGEGEALEKKSGPNDEDQACYSGAGATDEGRQFFVPKKIESGWTREHVILGCIAAGAVIVSALVMYMVQSATESQLAGEAAPTT